MEQSLAPQMLLSLKVLQAPIFDLQEMVRAELDSNPALEIDAPDIEIPVAGLFERDDHSGITIDGEKHQFMLDSLTAGKTLQDHLLEQLSLAGLDAPDRAVAEILIGSINDDGYLQLDTGSLIQTAPEFPQERFEKILSVIQGFDPAGVGARDLKECLLIQLRAAGKETAPEFEIVQNHLDRIGAHQYKQIAHEMGLPAEKIQQLAGTIAALDPKPGRNFSGDRTEFIIPEITVEKKAGVWSVTRNRTPYPRLFVSQKYLDLLQDKTVPPETRKYIRNKIAQSRFFIRSIDQRQETIYRIAVEIVNEQKDFLEEGVSALKPLTMKHIAGKLGVHETTVGRACAGKYIATPQGTFEFKYFFPAGIPLADGSLLSNTAIKDALASIVRSESRRRPLSDQRITDELARQGIYIARRTVAKYRDQLNILPARLRRQISVTHNKRR